MIQFTLKCAAGHSFDSWFQSADACDRLIAGGMTSCAICGTTQVEKALMAPHVARSSSPGAHPSAPDGAADSHPEPTLRDQPGTPAAQALAELRRRIERTSEYVGANFAREARDMHAGLTQDRPIHGEARPEEARKLLEEGVPVIPLPFVPRRKSN